MTPAEVKSARQVLAMTQTDLAQALRMGKDGKRAIRRWEVGDVPVSGPASVAIEGMLRGLNAWHDIAVAPIRVIVLTWSKDDGFDLGMRHQSGRWEYVTQGWIDELDGLTGPSHWMQLPKQPS